MSRSIICDLEHLVLSEAFCNFEYASLLIRMLTGFVSEQGRPAPFRKPPQVFSLLFLFIFLSNNIMVFPSEIIYKPFSSFFHQLFYCASIGNFVEGW